MRIRFTSIVWEDIGNLVNAALVSLEGEIRAQLEGADYGANVTSFLGVLVAVSGEDNARFSKQHTRVGYVTGLGGERFKQISLAVEMLPSELISRNIDEIANLFAIRLSSCVGRPTIKVPAGFNWISFSHDLKSALITQR